jgi:exonuclease SbcD
VHEGINFGYRVDAATGISDRALDLHNNFAKAARYAIENNAALFIILGDLFDRTHVSPTFRELVRKDVIEPLGNSKIKVWMIAGNHDQPHSSAKSTSLDDYRGYEHVEVFRKPAVEEIQLNKKSIGCIIMPYLHPEQIVKLVQKKENKEVGKEDWYALGRKLIKEWMKRRTEELDTDLKILFAHYYVEGAKLRETAHPEVLPGEFSFTRDMIPKELNLAVFGHIHLHQSLIGEPEVVYTGAIERIDWGEREDEKGFLIIDPDFPELWNFEPLPTREMIKINVDITDTQNPTKEILESIPVDIKEKMIRLEIRVNEGVRKKIEEYKISERLKAAFHYEVKWKEEIEGKTGFAEFTMNPLELFESFIETNYSTHAKQKEILKEGGEILREVLS